MVPCDAPGLVPLRPNARFCGHKKIAVARGDATVKPDDPFLIKLRDFGPDQVIIRKGSTVAFAELHLGQALTAISAEVDDAPKNGAVEARNGLNDINLL